MKFNNIGLYHYYNEPGLFYHECCMGIKSCDKNLVVYIPESFLLMVEFNPSHLDRYVENINGFLEHISGKENKFLTKVKYLGVENHKDFPGNTKDKYYNKNLHVFDINGGSGHTRYVAFVLLRTIYSHRQCHIGYYMNLMIQDDDFAKELSPYEISMVAQYVTTEKAMFRQEYGFNKTYNGYYNLLYNSSGYEMGYFRKKLSGSDLQRGINYSFTAPGVVSLNKRKGLVKLIEKKDIKGLRKFVNNISK